MSEPTKQEGPRIFEAEAAPPLFPTSPTVASAGLDKDVKPHGVRHTFATAAVGNGVDVATLAEILGHSCITTTAIYLHMANKRAHLNAAMEKAVKKPTEPKKEGQP